MTDLDVASIVALEVPDGPIAPPCVQELEAEGLRVAEPRQPNKVSVLRSIGPIAGALAVTTLVLVVATTSFALVTATRKRRGELAVLRTLGLRPAEVAARRRLAERRGHSGPRWPSAYRWASWAAAWCGGPSPTPIAPCPSSTCRTCSWRAARWRWSRYALLGAIPPARHAAAARPAEALRSE